MNWPGEAGQGSPSRYRIRAYGLGVTLVAAAAIVLPAAARLQRSIRDLARIRATYAQKRSWAGNKAELERRVAEQEAAVAELDARLLTGAEVAELTRAINAAARAAGCTVRSTRPAAPRTLPRATGKDEEDSAEARCEFVRWPVHVVLQGEYAQVSGALMRLRAAPWHVRIARLVLRPAGDDGETLICELDLDGYGLRPVTEG